MLGAAWCAAVQDAVDEGSMMAHIAARKCKQPEQEPALDTAPAHAARRQCHICTATESGAFCRLFLYDDLGNKVVTPGEWHCIAFHKWYSRHREGGQWGRQCGRSRADGVHDVHAQHACVQFWWRELGPTQTTLPPSRVHRAPMLRRLGVRVGLAPCPTTVGSQGVGLGWHPP